MEAGVQNGDGPTYRDALFIRERGFGKRLGFGTRPCFNVVDMINGVTDPSMPMGAEAGSQTAAINGFLEVCRSRRIPVIFTAIAYEEERLADAGICNLQMEGLHTLKSGTPAVELDARLHHRDGDTILVKKYASAFFGTDLYSRLTAHKVDTIIVAGCTTNGCVRATVVYAVQYGFRPIVLEDGVGDRFQVSHEVSLFDRDLKYADVMRAEDAIAILPK